MNLDPFFRLRKLIEDRFPEGDPTKIALHIGDPKGQPRQEIYRAIINKLDLSCYHPPQTLPELKNSIIYYNKAVHGVELKENQITAVHGTKSAIAQLPMIFGKSITQLSKSRICIPDLSYPTYFFPADFLSFNISFYSADKPVLSSLFTDYLLKYVIINNPHNPLGRVIKKDELENLAKKAQKDGFILISDECYIDIYKNQKPNSLLEFDKTGEFRNLLVLNSLSKSSCLPGLRSGFLAGDSNLIEKFSNYYGTTGNTLSRVNQAVSAMAWKDLEYIKENRERYQELLQNFAERSGLEAPEGAFYFFIKTPIDGEEFAVELLKKYGIKVMPGKYLDFQRSNRWNNYVRVPIAEKLEDKTIDDLLSML